MRRNWAVASILGLALMLPSMMDRAGATSRSAGRSPAAGQHLYILFVPGLCGWQYSDPYCHGHVNAQARARATFAALIQALSQVHARYTPLYYSYNLDHPDYYTVGDTHQAVARSTDALEQELRRVWQRDPHATFDLVGHSLGGVVSASWAVTDGRFYGLDPSHGLLQRVGSIVTFDSPLKGIQAAYTNNIIARLFGGEVWYSLQPDQETIKEILFFPTEWWRSTGHLHTVANVYDRIVPANEASLADTRLVRDNNCSRDLLVIRSCHGTVLSDTTLNHWVACNWITASSSCQGPPTATPAPTPPSPPTPSPAKTSTPPTPAPEGTPLGSTRAASRNPEPHA